MLQKPPSQPHYGIRVFIIIVGPSCPLSCKPSRQEDDFPINIRAIYWIDYSVCQALNISSLYWSSQKSFLTVFTVKIDKAHCADPFSEAWTLLLQRFENTLQHKNFPFPILLSTQTTLRIVKSNN